MLQRRNACCKHTSSRHKDKTDVLVERHSGKILQRPKVLRRRSKLLQGWRISYANAVNKTYNGNVLRCKFNEPKEGKIGGFSYLESLKKHKRRLHWGTFFEDSLVSSKKGKLAPTRRLFKTILTSVIKTRSLDDFFHF